MRILFLGDIVGKPGRRAVVELVRPLRQRLKADAVVANCENAAAGKGVTPEIADELLACGIDALTGGNHIWQYKQIESYLERNPRIVRPANYPRAPGRGATVIQLAGGRSLGILQVEGRVFMRTLDCPFAALDRELATIGRPTATLVDIHAEATSEKQALGWYLDGKVSAAIGTHTHVQTADERILPRGTAYLTDAGMSGPRDSIIGMEIEKSITRFLTQRPMKFEVATGEVMVCGALVETDDATGKALAISRVLERWGL